MPVGGKMSGLYRQLQCQEGSGNAGRLNDAQWRIIKKGPALPHGWHGVLEDWAGLGIPRQHYGKRGKSGKDTTSKVKYSLCRCITE